MLSVEEAKRLAEKYQVPQDYLQGVVELVEGQGWPPLKALVQEMLRQKLSQLDTTKDSWEIAKAQGGRAALQALLANIEDLYTNITKK